MNATETQKPELAQGVITKQVSVDGLSVTYHEAGQANTNVPPVVLVHGSMGSTERHFGFVFPMLAQRHRVISVDLTNPVKPTEPLELEHIEAQVLAVMSDACPNQAVTLLGYSLGAVAAAFLAARHPQRIANLVLLAGWAKTDTFMTLFNRAWHGLRAAGSPELSSFMGFAAYGAPFVASKSLEDLAKMRGGNPPTDFADAQMELNARIDITDIVPQITAPTLIINCLYDQMVPRHHGHALFGMIENARLAEVPSGHAIFLERPAELVRLVDRFAADPNEYSAGTCIPAITP